MALNGIQMVISGFLIVQCLWIHAGCPFERQTNSCLYDHTSAEYASKNKQEKAWERIAKELNQSVYECKERWKNLRGSYTRHLKNSYAPTGSARRKKAPYYLAEYMTFLEPFTKSRHNTGIFSTSLEDFSGDDNESDYINDDGIHDYQSEGDLAPESTLSSSVDDCKVLYDTQDCNSLYILTESRQSTSTLSTGKMDMDAQNASKSKRKNKDPDVSFLISILPDMKKMNDSQKRRFKIAILTSAGEILEDGPAKSTFQSMNKDSNDMVESGTVAPDSVEM